MFTYFVVKDFKLKNGEVAYSFEKAVKLAGEDPAKAGTNIENIVYWCIAMYFDKYNWSNGFPNPKPTAT